MKPELIFTGLGTLAFLVYTGLISFRNGRLLLFGIETEGTIIDFNKDFSLIDEISRNRPIIEFKTKHGKIMRFTSAYNLPKITSNPNEKTDGKIKVLYIESSPEIAEIKDYSKLLPSCILAPSLLIVFGIIFISLLLRT